MTSNDLDNSDNNYKINFKLSKSSVKKYFSPAKPQKSPNKSKQIKRVPSLPKIVETSINENKIQHSKLSNLNFKPVRQQIKNLRKQLESKYDPIEKLTSAKLQKKLEKQFAWKDSQAYLLFQKELGEPQSAEEKELQRLQRLEKYRNSESYLKKSKGNVFRTSLKNGLQSSQKSPNRKIT